jgi:hypothetical protein
MFHRRTPRLLLMLAIFVAGLGAATSATSQGVAANPPCHSNAKKKEQCLPGDETTSGATTTGSTTGTTATGTTTTSTATTATTATTAPTTTTTTTTGGGSFTVAAPQSPSAYALPASHVYVRSSAELLSALQLSNRDVVLADGIYDHSGPFFNTGGNRVYAEHVGGAVLTAGFVVGGNSGVAGSVLRGLTFSVSSPSKTLLNSVVHVWGLGGVNAQLLDLRLDGSAAIGAGIMARQTEGIAVRRISATRFVDFGVIIEPNNTSLRPAVPAQVSDITVSAVSRATPRSSAGTAEACLWIGIRAEVRRVRLRSCAWEGLWTGTAAHNSLFEDLDIATSGVAAIYLEHWTTNSVFRRFKIDCPAGCYGINMEWNDPSWGGTAASVDNIFEDGTVSNGKVGAYMQPGTTRTTLRRVTFTGQTFSAINDWDGVQNAYYDNVYRLSAGLTAITDQWVG